MNHISSQWEIPGGRIEVTIETDASLPSQVWPEVAVLMSIAQTFARRARQFGAIDELQTETQSGGNGDPQADLASDWATTQMQPAVES